MRNGLWIGPGYHRKRPCLDDVMGDLLHLTMFYDHDTHEMKMFFRAKMSYIPPVSVIVGQVDHPFPD